MPKSNLSFWLSKEKQIIVIYNQWGGQIGGVILSTGKVFFIHSDEFSFEDFHAIEKEYEKYKSTIPPNPEHNFENLHNSLTQEN